MNTQQDYDLFVERSEIVSGTLPTLEELNTNNVKIIHEITSDLRAYGIILEEPYLNSITAIFSITNMRNVDPVDFKELPLMYKIRMILK